MAGIDFGNMNCYMAVARNKGIEILMNDYSLHATPSCVSFGQSARLMGFGARQQFNIHFRNSVVNFKHLLGRKPSDPVVQTFSAFIPSEIANHPSGSVAFKVTHLGEQRVFTVEQMLVCLFTHLRSLLNKSLGRDVTESVLNVPYFFDQQQRIAMLTAGEVAGIKFRLVNDHAALAYNYGMYKGQILPKAEEPPKLVAFIDCGHSAVQACVVAFNADRAAVLGAESDLGIGGLHFDALIRDQFAATFKEKYRIDVRTNARAWLRLMDECEKLKKQMSANSQSIPLYIECFMNDVDVSGNMSRAQFEELAKPMFEKFEALLQRLVQTSQVRVEEISDVELVGGSSRVPRIKQIAAEFFKREPKTTMNQDDAIARGCALRSAMSYSAYQMKQYLVEDPYDIVIEPSKLPTEEALTQWTIVEQEMQAADQRDKERSDAKNALEEYCFRVQHSMENEQLCQGKLADDVRLACMSECGKVLDWLEMESDQLQKKQIECRHTELENFCAPLMDKLYAVEQGGEETMDAAEPPNTNNNDGAQQQDDADGAMEQEGGGGGKAGKNAKRNAREGGGEEVFVQEPMD